MADGGAERGPASPAPKLPNVLSLTPAEVLGPAHRELAGVLAPHSLTVPEATADLRRALPDADYVIGDWTHRLGLDASMLELAVRCRAIFQPTSGTETIDLRRAAELGIAVANCPGENARAVAEWTVMAMLVLLKDAWRHHEGVQAGRWEMVQAARSGVYELGGRTVGIVGFGAIGRAVAARLAGFEPGRVLYFDPVPAGDEVERRLGVERAGLDELCAASDVVSLHLPLTRSTRSLFDAGRIARLRPGAVLINVARGAVLDERALADALDAGRLRGAALDVFEQEPPGPQSPLRGRSNVLLSPHLAGSTNEARERMIRRTLQNLGRVLRGGEPLDVVNGIAGLPRPPHDA